MSPNLERESPALKLQLQAGQGEHLGRPAHRTFTTDIAANQSRVSIDQHERERGRIFRALQATCCTLATIQGQTATEIAAEVAARAIEALRNRQPEAAQREITR